MFSKTGKAWLFLVGFAATVASTHLQAAAIVLGNVSSPAGFELSQSVLLGPFEDTYSFSIDPGLTFEFTSFVTTGFSRRSGIEDFSGSLFKGSGLVASGISETRTLPEGFPAYDVSFEPVVLDAGNYILTLSGIGYGAFEGITSGYSGSATFAAPSAVPEPTSLLLAALGMAGLGGATWRARRKWRV